MRCPVATKPSELELAGKRISNPPETKSSGGCADYNPAWTGYQAPSRPFCEQRLPANPHFSTNTHGYNPQMWGAYEPPPVYGMGPHCGNGAPDVYSPGQGDVYGLNRPPFVAPNTPDPRDLEAGNYSPTKQAPTNPPLVAPSPGGGDDLYPGYNQRRMMCSIVIEPRYDVEQGPATVRMVSNSGPPLPMPMQVPPGHMVQQIVDENGILTHVILSPQPPGMTVPPMTVGYYPNGTPTQMYGGPGSYPPGAGPYYQPAATTAHPTTYGTQPGPHIHGIPHLHTPPPPAAHAGPCTTHPHVRPISGMGSPGSQDEHAVRTKARLQSKVNRRSRHDGTYYTHPVSPRPRPKNKHTHAQVNGEVRPPTSGSSSSGESMEVEEEQRAVRQLLSNLQQPTVSDVGPRSALIRLRPPDVTTPELTVDPAEFKYTLLICDKKDNKYNSVYSGDAIEITLKDLTPASEYHLKVICMLDDLKGEATEPVRFLTDPCEPDTPQAPKLGSRTKTSLLLKWNSTADNGSKITGYTLESDQGHGGKDNFVEVYTGLTRQFKVTKLTASTGYQFRLYAVSGCGRSKHSEVVCFYTNGCVPTEPDPPMLSEPYIKALVISWIRRPNDDEFMLQMDDSSTGHGFLTVFSGRELSFEVLNLRRNTEYKFRLQASNEEGSSRWSETATYRTLPDRPAAPHKPHVKGKISAHNFLVAWDFPKDNGGSEVKGFSLEMDVGRGYELIYEGNELEFMCDHLMPGSNYRLRVNCQSAGGVSEWSESLCVMTQPVPPGPCLPPKLHNKPRATSVQLKWGYPDYTGGAPITEFHILQKNRDHSTREVYQGRDLECTVAGLLPGRTYHFLVQALNKAGAGPWSDGMEVLSGAGVPDPPRPPLLHCRSSHCAAVSWEEPANNGAAITEYRLEWQPPEADFTQIYFGSSLCYEVRGLLPASTYIFRVQALNSAGAGPFSEVSEVTTPCSSPGAVVSVKASTTPDSIHLTWREPPAHGSPITAYNLDFGERPLLTVEATNEYTMTDLTPETSYKIRVQAVNSIGVGAFSSHIKVTTRALPPNPPHLECVSAAPNSLKLKWGDGRNPDLLQYCLEMMRDNGSFHPIYQNTGHTYKVSKLSEVTEYTFRIYASNEAGDGPSSPPARYRTTKAPPPAVKAPSVVELGLDWCRVSWPPLKQMGQDTLIYTLHLQGPEHEYRQVYRGPELSYVIRGLRPRSDHQVRVGALRVSAVTSELYPAELPGAFSPGVPFTTHSLRPTDAQDGPGSSGGSRSTERRPLTDQQWAVIFLLCFALCAVVFAFLAQQIITYTSGSSETVAATTAAEQVNESAQ